MSRRAALRPGATRRLLWRAIALSTLALTLGVAAACGSGATDDVALADVVRRAGAASPQAAVGLWTELVQQAPGDPRGWLGRGVARAALGDAEAAVLDLQHAFELDPTDAAVRLALATVEEERGAYRAADEALGNRAGGDARAQLLGARIDLGRAATTLREIRAALVLVETDAAARAGEALRVLDIDRAAPDVAVALGPDAEASLQDARHAVAAARARLERLAVPDAEVEFGARISLAQYDLLAGAPDRALARLVNLPDRLRTATGSDSGFGRSDTDSGRSARVQAAAHEARGEFDALNAALDAALLAQPGDSATRATRAIARLRAGRTDDARSDLAALGDDPHHAVHADFVAALLDFADGDANSAMRRLEAAVRLRPTSALLHVWLGLARAETGGADEGAALALEEATRLAPASFAARLARGALALARGRYDVAHDHARAATAIAPDRAEGWLLLGRTRASWAAQEHDAVARFALYDAAATALARARELAPTSSGGRTALALELRVAGTLPKALATLERLREERPDPRVLVALARLLSAERRDAEALECLYDAVAAAPEDADATAALAGALARGGDSREAERVLERLVGGGSVDALVALCELLLRQERLAELHAVLARARDQGARSAELERVRLHVAHATGDLRAAQEACAAGRALAPRDRAFHQVGVLAAARGDLARGSAWLSESLEAYPDDPVLLAARALVAGLLLDRATAGRFARRAIEHARGDPRLVAAAAAAVNAAGDVETARTLTLAATAVPTPVESGLWLHIEQADLAEEAAALARVHLAVLAAPPPTRPTTQSAIEERIEERTRIEPTSDIVLLDLLADVRAARRDATGAAASLLSLLEVQPRVIGARQKLGWIRLVAGELPSAARQVEMLDRAQDDTPGTHVLAAALLQAQGDLEGALARLDRAVTAGPTVAGLARRRARVLDLLQRPEQARAAYAQALDENPEEAEALAGLAELTFDVDPARAELLARRAVGIAPRAAFSRSALATVLSRAGRPREAVAELARAAAASEDADVWHRYGALAARLGDAATARRALGRAIALDPSRADALTRLGMLVEESGDEAGAERHYEASLAADPTEWRAANNLAAILTRRKSALDRALELAEQAVRRSGRDAAALDTLGWVYQTRGEHALACAALHAAAQDTRSGPSVRYRLAVALRDAGRPEASRAEVERALAAGAFPERAAAEQLLTELGD